MTSRDRELVEWIARFGAAGVDDLRVRFGLGRTVAYRRVAACVERRLVERVRLLHGEPALLVATRRGLHWSGQERLGPCHVGLSTFAHYQAVARVAALTESAGARLLSERELRSHEREERRLIASIEINRRGERRTHSPDLVIVRSGELPVCVEVELSVKGSARLAAICQGWARARHIAGVRYYAAPQAARAVARAVEVTAAQAAVDIRPLPWIEA